LVYGQVLARPGLRPAPEVQLHARDPVVLGHVEVGEADLVEHDTAAKRSGNWRLGQQPLWICRAKLGFGQMVYVPPRVGQVLVTLRVVQACVVHPLSYRVAGV
jgi:hypothetical protein